MSPSRRRPTTAWHPRGELTWPEWRDASPGARVQHVRSGRRGTFVRWPKTPPLRNPGYAVIHWDDNGYRGGIGRVVAYAFDLRQLS